MADRSQNETEDPTRKEEEGKEYPEEEGGDDENQRSVDRRRKKDDCSDDDEEEEESGTNVSDRHGVTSNGDKGTKGRQQLTGEEEEEREGESNQEGGENVDVNYVEGESQEGQEDIELKQDTGHTHEEEEQKKDERKEEEEEGEDDGGEENPEEEEGEEEEGEEEEEEEGEGEEEEREEKEEEETEVLTKDNPMFVPRAGPYFYHDSRFDDQEETGEADQPKTETMPAVTKLKCEELDKWEHDLYVAEEQKPREEWEKKKDRDYYENLERRRNRERDGDGTDRSNRGRGSKLGDFMPSQGRRGGAGNFRERQNRKDWKNESGRYQEKEYRDKGRERRDGQYHQERNYERRGNRRDFRQYNQEREGGREGNRDRRDFNKRRGNSDGRNQTVPQENWEGDQEREKESWENNGENWDQDLETLEMNRKTKNKEKDSKERQSGFKNQQGRSNQRDEHHQGTRHQRVWSSERNEERHQQGRQRNNGGREGVRRGYDNDWQPSEGNRPTNREENEAQIKNEDSTKKDDSANDSTPTNQETGESQSLFSFSSSRVFSLSVNDRLVVREVDHSKTSGRRIGRGRGRGRGITSGSKDIGIVGKTMNQLVSSNEDPPVTNNNDTVTSGTDPPPPPPDSDITNSDGNDKPVQEAAHVTEGQDTIVGDPVEPSEADSKGGPGKPKRYSSRRQKPDQPEGTDLADKTISSTGMDYPQAPPPFGYGWVYPPHPSMIPHQLDPNSYQTQQQLHFYQQQMRLLQDMYSQHIGGTPTGPNPPLIPLLPHLMGPQDQFTLLPAGTHFPSLTPPPPRYPLSSGDLKPSPTVDSSHESSPSPAVGAPAATEKKPSQAIPIVAPGDTQ